jgi:predicted RNase H-like HicB family nuclease
MNYYRINICYTEEDKGYIADIPDLRYCSAVGATLEEAVREVLNAKAAWLEAAKSEGKPIPKPTADCKFMKYTRLSNNP